MDKKRAQELIERYRSGSTTAEELAQIENWIMQGQVRDMDLSDAQLKAELDLIRKRLPLRYPTRRLVRFLPYAAATIIVALAGTWLFVGDKVVNRKAKIVNIEEILPGGNRATLTLADGRTITLDEAQEGIIIGDEDITYTDGSTLTMSPLEGGRGVNTPSEMLSLTTPRGGTYQVTLPDGSKVWLNANSTLKYPSRFSGEERVVELTGEAYFSIRELVNQGTSESGSTPKTKASDSQIHKLTKSQKVPFKVVSQGQQVEVLGTEFNISAYPDENETKTTLVNGSVEIVNLTSKIVNRITPGEQSIIQNGDIRVNEVDISPIIAWKNGDFEFNGQTIRQIMPQLARWYAIDVVYEGDIPEETFYGKIARSKNINEVLELLESAEGVRFKIAGRRVIVMK